MVVICRPDTGLGCLGWIISCLLCFIYLAFALIARVNNENAPWRGRGLLMDILDRLAVLCGNVGASGVWSMATSLGGHGTSR